MNGVFKLVQIFLVIISFSTAIQAVTNKSEKTVQRWGWFSAISTMGNWSIEQGSAIVDIKGNAFNASLLDSSSQERIALKGTIKKNKLELVATRNETEDAPRKLTGTIGKIKWPDGQERESVSLSENGKPWGLVIGITRELTK